MGKEKEGSGLEEKCGYTVPSEAVEGHGRCSSVNGTVTLSLCTSILKERNGKRTGL